MPGYVAEKSKRLTAGEWLLLGLASSYSPLSVMGKNLAGFPHPERLVGLALLVCLLAAALAGGLTRVGMSRRSAVRVVFVWVLLVMEGGRALREFGSAPGILVLSVVAVLAFWVLRRIGSTTAVSVAVGVIAAFLGAFVLVSTYRGVSAIGEDATTPGNSLGIELASHPDIFLVLLDGYPGLFTFEAFGDTERGPFVSELGRLGFQTPDSAWAAYGSTAASIPSLLDMRYPFDSPSDSIATLMSSFRTTAGDNEFMRTLAGHGYELIVTESGWSGSSCGPSIDHCVRSSVYNESMAVVLSDTLFGPAISNDMGTPFTIGSERSMSWLLEHAGEISRDAVPSLVYAHIGIPHPPFYFDSQCSRVVDPGRSEATYLGGNVSEDERRAIFAEQVDCVDLFVKQLVNELDEDAVVVLTSDHGSGRLRQLGLAGEQWDDLRITERLNVFVSVRAGCDIGDQIILPNLLRRVLSCLSVEKVPDLPLRLFLPPSVEIDSGTVDRLVNSSGG